MSTLITNTTLPTAPCAEIRLHLGENAMITRLKVAASREGHNVFGIYTRKDLVVEPGQITTFHPGYVQWPTTVVMFLDGGDTIPDIRVEGYFKMGGLEHRDRHQIEVRLRSVHRKREVKVTGHHMLARMGFMPLHPVCGQVLLRRTGETRPILGNPPAEVTPIRTPTSQPEATRSRMEKRAVPEVTQKASPQPQETSRVVIERHYYYGVTAPTETMEEATSTPVIKEIASPSVRQEGADMSVTKEVADPSVVEETADPSVVKETADPSVVEETADSSVVKDFEERTTKTIPVVVLKATNPKRAGKPIPAPRTHTHRSRDNGAGRRRQKDGPLSHYRSSKSVRRRP